MINLKTDKVFSGVKESGISYSDYGAYPKQAYSSPTFISFYNFETS